MAVKKQKNYPRKKIKRENKTIPQNLGLNIQKKIKPEIRYLDDIREVLYDKKWAKKAQNVELYYMYRGIKKKGNLSYDITVIPPRMLGKEFVKTYGHYHLKKTQEIYIVLKGKGIFLMQKGKDIIEDVVAIEAKKGEKVLIPPLFGHVTINHGKKNLITANWVDQEAGHDYKSILKKQGACYYYTKDGWIKNKNYKKVPKIRFEKPNKNLDDF
jgi:glucose-6-phosphate isomerase